MGRKSTGPHGPGPRNLSAGGALGAACLCGGGGGTGRPDRRWVHSRAHKGVNKPSAFNLRDGNFGGRGSLCAPRCPCRRSGPPGRSQVVPASGLGACAPDARGPAAPRAAPETRKPKPKPPAPFPGRGGRRAGRGPRRHPGPSARSPAQGAQPRASGGMAARSLGRGLGRLLGRLRGGRAPRRAASGASGSDPAAAPASYQALSAQAARDPAAFWGPLARDSLVWDAPYHTVCDCDLRGGRVGWFLGGRLNVSGEWPRGPREARPEPPARCTPRAPQTRPASAGVAGVLEAGGTGPSETRLAGVGTGRPGESPARVNKRRVVGARGRGPRRQLEPRNLSSARSGACGREGGGPQFSVSAAPQRPMAGFTPGGD